MSTIRPFWIRTAMCARGAAPVPSMSVTSSMVRADEAGTSAKALDTARAAVKIPTIILNIPSPKIAVPHLWPSPYRSSEPWHNAAERMGGFALDSVDYNGTDDDNWGTRNHECAGTIM
jgi:hypothetical protein